jgi:hypothetical protein
LIIAAALGVAFYYSASVEEENLVAAFPPRIRRTGSPRRC